MTLHGTAHAIERYQQRVRNCSEAAAIAALSSKAIEAAAMFGAPYVRLGTGQRIVLDHETVVTVLHAETPTIYIVNYGRGRG